MVTLPPLDVANVPLLIVAPAGASFAVRRPDSGTAGVDGVAVAPPVTYACVLFTRSTYVSFAANGGTAIENEPEPLQPYESVAVIVKLNVPVAVGVPVIAPVDELSERPGGEITLERAIPE